MFLVSLLTLILKSTSIFLGSHYYFPPADLTSSLNSMVTSSRLDWVEQMYAKTFESYYFSPLFFSINYYTIMSTADVRHSISEASASQHVLSPDILSEEPGSIQPSDADSSNSDAQSTQWNASSYFSPNRTNPRSSFSGPASPAEVAKGARSGAELLRKLSIVSTSNAEVFRHRYTSSSPGAPIEWQHYHRVRMYPLLSGNQSQWSVGASPAPRHLCSL